VTTKNDRSTRDRLSPIEAAEYLGVRVQTLSVWRTSRRYPLPYVKIGSKVQYRRADLDKFIESRVVGAE
jgi:excisionase family DNA binding protein